MRNLWLVITAGILLSGCNEFTQSIKDTISPEDTVASENTSQHVSISVHTETHTSKPLLTDTAELEKAEQALKALPQYAGKKIMAYRIVYFYDYGTINIILRHPDNPKYMDTYTYSNDRWSAPVPLQLSVNDDTESNLIPLDEISFADAATVAGIYNEKAAGIEGAKPVSNVYLTIRNKQTKWYPTEISGSRERYSIEFNRDGTLKEMKRI